MSIYYKKRSAGKQEKTLSDYVMDNILQRQFHEEVLNKVLVSDITYVPCRDGTHYLAAYVDLASRMPRAFQVSANMKTSLVIEPLLAFLKRTSLKGSIIHTDRGSQYRSYMYKEILQEQNVTHSMSDPGCPLDNAVAESFFKAVKTELIRPNRHKTKAEMKVLLENYLEDYYPHKRIHTVLGMTPYQFEQQLNGL